MKCLQWIKPENLDIKPEDRHEILWELAKKGTKFAI